MLFTPAILTEIQIPNKKPIFHQKLNNLKFQKEETSSQKILFYKYKLYFCKKYAQKPTILHHILFFGIVILYDTFNQASIHQYSLLSLVATVYQSYQYRKRL